MIDISFFYPYVAAAVLALTWAISKYGANILDPSKQTPDEFLWPKAATTVIIAVGVSVIFTASGKALDLNGLDTQMGIFAGVVTPYIQPVVLAVWRKASEKFYYFMEI